MHVAGADRVAAFREKGSSDASARDDRLSGDAEAAGGAGSVTARTQLQYLRWRRDSRLLSGAER
jgi:hypothetical protein